METFSHKRERRASKSILFVGILVLFTMLLAACGSSTTTGGGSTPTANPQTPTVAPPSDLITPGTLTVGSDTTYPPFEYIDTATGQAKGFDVDLITAIAQRMGLQAKIVTTKFDTIIDDAGNPLNIKNTADLCGKNVGVQDGTTEQIDLKTANAACVKAGKPAINVTTLQDQTAVIQLLASHRVVATYQDSPLTDYYNKLNPGQFTVGGSVVNAGPEGIVVRKGDTSMFNAVQTVFNQLKTSGAYHSLILKWGFTSEEIH